MIELNLGSARFQCWQRDGETWGAGWVFPKGGPTAELILEAWTEDDGRAQRILRELAEWSEVDCLLAQYDLRHLTWQIGAYGRGGT